MKIYYFFTVITTVLPCPGLATQSRQDSSGNCVVSRPSGKAAEIYADCSGRNLTQVPSDLPANITCLNLVGNRIVEINGAVWTRYDQLQNLSLARNCIERIDNSTFTNLSSLRMLDLSLNFIRYTQIDDLVFLHMKSLKYLDIKQNLSNIWINETYPEAIRHLSGLETLILDGVGQYFGIYLPNLKELYLSGSYGRCNIPAVDGNTFKNVANLQDLFLSNCSVRQVEFEALKILKNLTSLDVSWNTDLTMKGVPNITSGLTNSNVFKRLNINSLYDLRTFDFCVSVDVVDLKYLYNTSLELLLIENNNIIRMEPESVQYLPRNLKYVSVHHNMFLYGPYLQYLLFNSSVVRKLLYYDTSHMVAANRPLENGHTDISMDCSPCEAMFTRIRTGDYFAVIENRLKKYSIGSTKEQNGEFETKLEYLDLSRNIPEMINRTLDAFGVIQNLKFLNVSLNFLGYPLYDSDTFFQSLSKLETLDLSGNGIIRLKTNVFKPLNSLKTLIISNNKLSDISFQVDGMPKLKYLDLRQNFLEIIPRSARMALDKLVDIKVNIQDNNIKCNCDKDVIEFLQWVKQSESIFENLNDTYCFDDSRKNVTLAELRVDKLYDKCFPPTYFILILISCLMITSFFIIIIVGIVYRYRWDLRYLYYISKLNLQTGQYQNLSQTEYFRDAFISYADEDRSFVCQQLLQELEEKGQISLLLHDRDFWPGEWVADNILKAIRKTRKTVIVLTNAYISRHWCKYEMNMARLEAAHTGRNVVCVILKEHININKSGLPLEIVDVLRQQTYIEFPQRPENLEEFWNRLRTTLNYDR